MDVAPTWLDELSHADVASACGKGELTEHRVRFGITSVSVNPDAVDAARRVVAAAERRILLDAARARS